MRRYVVLAVAIAAAIWFFCAGRWLVVSDPQPSQAALVLNGEYAVRPSGGVAMLRRGMAPRMVLDVSAHEGIFGHDLADLARQWVAAQPEAASITICPVSADSTKQEVADAVACLGPQTHTVLLVTSDYHSRRALSVFSHMDKSRRYTVEAIPERYEFGTQWWRRRRWAKTTAGEWAKLIWWEAVERWT